MRRKVFGLLMAITLLWPSLLFCAEGGDKATALAHQAPDPGPGANWLIRLVVDTYNHNMILYALIALGIMTGMGLVLGYATDKFLEILGFETKKLEHHE